MSFLRGIGTKKSPIWDAAERGVPSGAILFAHRKFIEECNKRKINPDVPKSESGLIQMIRMGKSIRHKGVNISISLTL